MSICIAVVGIAETAHADPTARAEPSAAQRATAEALFRDGKELQAQGDLDKACPKFVESNKLDPKPGALLNAAACHEEQGKTASAWEEYREAIAIAAKYNQPERREFAEKKVKELDAKLARVVITMASPPPELTIQVDDQPMGAALLGTPFPVDPGAHRITATAPRYVSASRAIVVGAGPSLTETELLALAPEPWVARAKDEGTPRRDASARERHTFIPPTPSLVLFGAALAGASLGTAFGISALDKKSEVDRNCQGSFCSPAGLEANDDAHRDAAISSVAFAVFGAAAVAGGLYWFWRPRATPTAFIAPQASAHAGGIVFGGSL